jgi:hypothetical protein
VKLIANIKTLFLITKEIIKKISSLYIVFSVNLRKLQSMNKIDRYKILMRHIVSSGIAPSQKAFAALLGYSNESSFSQIINEKVKEPKDFIHKIKRLVPGLNTEWLQTGEGEMISQVVQTNQNGDNINGKTVKVTKDSSDKLIEVILEQSKQISKSQEQIDRLISIIEQK